MIVQCPQCTARFRVADEKVPERGVKVRCTKCTTVFKVTRADAVDGAARSRDDFGFGGGTPGPGTPGPAPAPAPTRTPAPGAARGTGSGRRSESFDLGEPTGPLATGAAPPPAGRVPPAVSLTYGAALPAEPPGLELGLGSPGRPPPRSPGPPGRQPGRPPPSQPPDPGALDLGLAPAMRSSAFDDLPPAPPPRPAPRPAPAAIPPPDDPFADLDLGPPPGPAQASPPPASFATASAAAAFHDPFAELDLSPPPPPASPRLTPPPMAMAPRLGDTDPFAVEPAYDDRDPPPRAAPPPAPRAAPPELSDPFAGLESVPGGGTSTGPSREGGDPQPLRGADDGPHASDGGTPRPRGGGPGDFGFSEGPAGPKIDLEVGRPGREAEGVADVGRIQLSRGASDKPVVEDQKAAARSRLRREFASATFNALSATVVGFAALVSIATVRSPRPLTPDDLGFPVVWLALGLDDGHVHEQLRAVDARTGAFETRAGGELFYVTGLAENASSAHREALQVAVEVLRNNRIIARAESLAQLRAGPEELFALDSRRNDDLQRVLAGRAASLGVPPRSRAPFIAVFPMSAQEVEGAEVRLTVLDGIPAGVRDTLPAGLLRPAPAVPPVEAAADPDPPAPPTATAPAPSAVPTAATPDR